MFYEPCDKSVKSLVDGLRYSGETNTSKKRLSEIATANGITYYNGTKGENLVLLRLLKKGYLRK